MEYNYVLLLVIRIFDKHNHSYYIILQWVDLYKINSLFSNDFQIIILVY